jgi:hypothetical protein
MRIIGNYINHQALRVALPHANAHYWYCLAKRGANVLVGVLLTISLSIWLPYVVELYVNTTLLPNNFASISADLGF